MPIADVNGINTYYQVQGRGEPLLLIMGLSGDHGAWFFQVRAFKPHYTVITYDSRGIGRTGRPVAPSSIRDLADDAVGLMDHLGVDKAHVLGVSMGGMVAQEIAINYPDRVSKLILGCTTAGGEHTDDMHPALAKALGIKGEVTRDDLESEDFGRWLGPIMSLSFNKWRYRIPLWFLAKSYLRRVGVRGTVGQLRAIMGHTTEDRLHLIQAPTLVMAGTKDRLVLPRRSEAIASRIPGARLVMVKGGSHAFQAEMRIQFNREVLSFLKEGQH